MIAALPMYDRPATAPALDRLWALIRDALRAAGHPAPDRLHRGADLWRIWTDPNLILAQSCGLPYRARLRRQVQLIATPDHAVPGCPPGHYRSLLLVRADDWRGGPHGLSAWRGARLAVNAAESQSGWAAPAAHLAAAGVPVRPVGPTGGHAASARAVADGRADIAGVDAVTWRLLEAEASPLARALRVLAATAPTPGLPLIAGPRADAGALRAALAAAVAGLAPADRAALGLRGIVRLPPAAYLALPLPPEPWASGARTPG